MNSAIPQALRVRKKTSEAIALAALEEPIRAELFSAERLEQHGESLAAAQRVTTTPRKGRPLLPRVLDNGRVLLESYRAIAQAIRRSAPSHLRRNGWSTIITSSTNNCARSRTTCHPAIIENCLSWPRVHSRGIRASMGWPGHSSPIPTAGLTRKCCVGSCAPTSACSR